ncbi:MAG: DUF4215 domain-containing protein [Deltaproteobacteria bacterium]|nr:DUF4215 domain-containing protein [Deltaproteobacteria bacterium]MBT6434320.1 DUF4215 domain-containing protein [Deltaproteobacteria bacterium]
MNVTTASRVPSLATLAICIGFIVLSACASEPGDTDETTCSSTSDCSAGWLCENSTCVPACFDDTDCKENQLCNNSVCVDSICGDGVIEANEDCDNGEANSNSAACTADCKIGACGDGLLLAGEEVCDDGNLDDADGCDSNCTETACGNGVLTAGEECDDGNSIDYDGCDADCTFTECPPSVPEGTVCGDDGVFCNGQEVCTEGFCVSNGNPCVEDDLACTPLLCDEENSVCNPLDQGFCLIDEACVTDMARNSENGCEYCDTNLAVDAWQSFGESLTLDNPSYWADEGSALGDSCGAGSCTAGSVICNPDALDSLVCDTASLASTEVCNLLDDDCDGAYDEGFWVDSSNVGDAGVEEDFPDGADSTTPAYRTYPELSNGVISGRILPAGDVDIIRIDATEALSDIIPDAPFRVELTLSSASGPSGDNWYWLCACWSHNDPTCLYAMDRDQDCWLATGTQPAETGQILRSNSSTVLDETTLWIRIEPDLPDLDYSCDNYNLLWTIFEQ